MIMVVVVTHTYHRPDNLQVPYVYVFHCMHIWKWSSILYYIVDEKESEKFNLPKITLLLNGKLLFK